MSDAIIYVENVKFYVPHDGDPSSILPGLIDTLNHFSMSREVIGELAMIFDKTNDVVSVDWDYKILYGDPSEIIIKNEDIRMVIHRGGNWWWPIIDIYKGNELLRKNLGPQPAVKYICDMINHK